MILRPVTELTYRNERFRAVSAGILESAGTTFLLLIAVRWFKAGAAAKSIVAGGASMGLLVSPLLVTFVQRRGWPTSLGASRLFSCAAIAFLFPALFPIQIIFVVASALGLAAAASVIPLLTQMYQENYPEEMRGRLFSRTVMIRIATIALFSEFAGRALTRDIGQFRSLLFIFSAACAWAAYTLGRCPTEPLRSAGGTHPFRALRYAREDALFRRTLICWMFMGFANLMMLPLRVEYLANPKYGQVLEVSMIALLTAVIPNLARLVLSPVWGWLFDHMNFFTLRVILNAGFALGILTFFTSHTFGGLVFGAIVFGISNAGGDVAWSLWVTKFAPPDRVADYMSVHTFFTGIRGVLAPVAAFQLIARWSVFSMGCFSAALIVAATMLLLPEVRWGRGAKRASALVEEVSD